MSSNVQLEDLQVPHANYSNRNWILTGLILGLFLSALEVTVVATAMPDVIEDLGGRHLYSLPFAVYLLLSTVSSPLWGYATDLYGRRRLYLVCVSLFILGSALCGAASSMLWLIGARVIQGLGAGGVMTLTFTIVGELYPLEQRSRVQGYISAVWGFSALVGPLIGGFIVDYFSWRWVFYLNLPFGIAGVALVLSWYRDRIEHRSRQLDLLGAALFTSGAGLLVYGLQMHQILLVLPGLVALLFFPRLELRQPMPLVPVRLLRDQFLARTVLGNFLAGVGFFGITAYLPLFVQLGRGESATMGGALLSPMVVGWTLSSLLVARLLPRLGPRLIAGWGAGGMVLGFVLMMLSLSRSLWILGATGLVSGFGMGAIMVALLVAAQEEAPREVLGSVTAMLLFSRSIGGSIGSALMGALLGTALTEGTGGAVLAEGAALAAVFWRVPAASAILSFGTLLVVTQLPDLSNKGHATKVAGQIDEVVTEESL